MMIRKLLETAAVGAAVVLVGAGCSDLDVENPNAPDTRRALASAGDVKSLIGSSFLGYWEIAQFNSSGALYAGLADQNTSAWGNYGYLAYTSEPRVAWDNSPQVDSDIRASGHEPWFECYAAIRSASDGLRAMDEGIVDLGADAPVARAWAKLTQGLCHGFLGMVYDKAYIVDEGTQLTDEAGNAILPEFHPYNDVVDAAIGYLQEAMDIASANSFTTPASWMNGTVWDSDRMVAVIHSYMARFMANTPRSPSEAGNVDWAAVESHIRQGVGSVVNGTGSDFVITGGAGPWWSGMKVWSAWPSFLAHIDVRQVGPADQSGQYQDWIGESNPELRMPFDVETPDARIPDPGGIGAEGYVIHAAAPFPPERGTYHLSNYARSEYIFSYFTPNFTFDGPIVEISRREMDMLLAEALIEQGKTAEALDILNYYRVNHGGLPPATAAGVAGPDCVPRTDDGSCGDLEDVLAYEFGIEEHATSAGIAYSFDRRHGLLVSGTFVHYPVPGKELEIRQEPLYTFGGQSGQGAAPAILPGDEESILRRVQWDLQDVRSRWHADRGKRTSVSPRK